MELGKKVGLGGSGVFSFCLCFLVSYSILIVNKLNGVESILPVTVTGE